MFEYCKITSNFKKSLARYFLCGVKAQGYFIFCLPLHLCLFRHYFQTPGSLANALWQNVDKGILLALLASYNVQSVPSSV